MASRNVLLLALVAAAAVAATTAAETKQVDASVGRQSAVEKYPFDITWMTESNKRVLDNFITWYKLQLSQLVNVLNPVNWNLDLVLPAVSSVITLYTGPIVALGILLLIFFTIPTLASGLLLNTPGRSIDGSVFTPAVDAVWYAVQKALDHTDFQE
ncbi:uncharacterized protein LOC122246594 [Penaeus japonicus]|uniref:uncharacterized protein LOC122246594 n=1 Tax=Penaeus japonicus TaxID=27405 RepID=UPI001C7145C5|nr:uncharacterized protein LOC122246594 [Penaeus japonicus]